MTRQFKTFLKTCFAILALIGVGWILHLCARPMIKYVDHCDMPCQWSYDAGFESCQPLKMELEVKMTPEPRGRGQAIWYRATVTNQSCGMIEMPDASFFLGDTAYSRNPDKRRESLILVTDDMGRPATIKEEKPAAGIFDRLNEVVPYQYVDREVLPAIKIINDPGFQKFNVVDLIPGQSVSTSYSKLAPFRYKMIDVQTKGFIGTAVIPDEVSMDHPEKRFAVPPPEFRHLNEYDLKTPGRYKAQLKIDESVGVSLYDDNKTSLQKKLSPWIHLFGKGEWSQYRTKEAHLNVSSAPIEFQVPR